MSSVHPNKNMKIIIQETLQLSQMLLQDQEVGYTHGRKLKAALSKPEPAGWKKCVTYSLSFITQEGETG